MTRSTNMNNAEVLERLRERCAALDAAIAALSAPNGEVVVTRDEAGAIVAVTRQDAEGRILSVIAEAAQQPAACVACEGAPGFENSPCAVCGQQPAAGTLVGFDEWFDEYTKNNYTDEMLAEAAWKAALAAQPGSPDNG